MDWIRRRWLPVFNEEGQVTADIVILTLMPGVKHRAVWHVGCRAWWSSITTADLVFVMSGRFAGLSGQSGSVDVGLLARPLLLASRGECAGRRRFF
jgi:hypothetical protein